MPPTLSEILQINLNGSNDKNNAYIAVYLINGHGELIPNSSAEHEFKDAKTNGLFYNKTN
jgi:hypothetical protein